MFLLAIVTLVMNMLFRIREFSAGLSAGLLLGSLLACGASPSLASGDLAVTGSLPEGTHAKSAVAGFSAGIAEILKLADAKLDAEVIKAFIKNSPTPYDPTASEIILLKH